MMKSQPIAKNEWASCRLPRRKEAIEALLLLAWRKGKKERPSWLIKEINSHC